MTKSKPIIAQGWLRAIVYFFIICLLVYGFQVFGDTLTTQLGLLNEGANADLLNFGLLYTLMGVFIFLLTWAMRTFVDRQSFQSLGFTFRGYTSEAGLGFFIPVALLGLGTLVLITSGLLTFLAATFDWPALLLEVLFMLIVAFTEELLFRGYLLNNLMQSMNRWIALIISSLLFALFHQTNPDVNIFAIINIFLAGLLLGLNYVFTKNLWFGICFHFAWNYFQGPVFGYDVSGLKLTSIFQQSIVESGLWTGGAFGFEGSLLCPILFSISFVLFTYFFKQRYSVAAT